MSKLTGVLLVCGGRDFNDLEFVWSCLDKVAQRVNITAVRHGAARGADTLADDWAVAEGIPVERMPADWKTHGRAAGPIRNSEMLKRESAPVAAVAFPGGSGTADMVKKCKKAGVPVWEPKP